MNICFTKKILKKKIYAKTLRNNIFTLQYQNGGCSSVGRAT